MPVTGSRKITRDEVRQAMREMVEVIRDADLDLQLTQMDTPEDGLPVQSNAMQLVPRPQVSVRRRRQ